MTHRHSRTLALRPTASSESPEQVHNAAVAPFHRNNTSSFASSCFCSATWCKPLKKKKKVGGRVEADGGLEAEKQISQVQLAASQEVSLIAYVYEYGSCSKLLSWLNHERELW